MSPNKVFYTAGPLLGIAILLLGNILATGADVVVKLLSDAAGIYQYLFLRQLLLIAMLLPFFLKQSPAQKRPAHIRFHIIRGNLTVIGGGCVVLALMELSLATANVIFYTSPVITLLIASFWFKEPLLKHRIINILFCFGGVIVAMQPDDLGWGAAAAFLAAFCIAGYNVSVRWIPSHNSSISVMFWSCVTSVPALAVLSMFNWQPWSWDLLYLVIGTALCVGLYQICCVLAYRKAEAGAIAIAEYSGLVFAAILGWWIFSEEVDIWTAAGIAMIILPIFWQSRVEHKSQKFAAEKA